MLPKKNRSVNKTSPIARPPRVAYTVREAMSWILFAFAAGLLWTIVNVIDKYIIGHEYHDATVATVVKSLIVLIIFSSASFFSGSNLNIPLPFIILSMLSGTALSIAILFYYQSLKTGEISTVTPIFATAPLFILLIGSIFLGERFPLSAYIGVCSVAIGAAIMGMERKDNRFKLNRAAMLALGVALFSSVRSVLVKEPANEITIWPLLFWIGLGCAITSLPLLILHYRRIESFHERLARKGIRHFIVGDVLDALGTLCFFIAIGLGPVSLVAAIVHAKAFIVFLVALIGSALFPSLVSEPLSRPILAKKALGTLVIVFGVLMILL